MPVNTGIYLRRGTTTQWTSTNPVLSAGEIGVEYSSTNVLVGFKIGNGTTAWNSLGYPPAGSTPLSTNLIGGLAGSIPFQSGPSTTAFLPIGSNGQFLSISGGGLSWQNVDLTNLSASNLTSGTLSMDRIASAAITYAKIQDVSALSVFGRSAATSGVGADIAAGSDGQVLRRSGTSIGFGTVVAAGIEDGAVTPTKLQQETIDLFSPRFLTETATRTANYTLALTDINRIVPMNGSNLSLIIPTDATVNFPLGSVVTVYNLNSTNVVISASGVTVRNTEAVRQFREASLRKRGTNEWVMIGG